MIGIYKITNPNGRIYIGQSINIKYRFDTYRRLGIGVSTSIKLYRSLLKHGYENHIFEVIEECKIENLNNRERYWQDFYNANSEINLNCKLTKSTDKSGVGVKISDYQKLQISKVHKGKILSNETKEKIKKARAKQIITQEHKNKMSKNSKSAKLVLDTQSGVFYNSVKELATLYNIKPNTLVCRLIGKVTNKTNFIYV